MEVQGLIPAGTEPHDWEPSAKDIADISDADVFVYNGIVESWTDQAVKSAANGKRVVVEASRGITLLERGEDEAEDEDGRGHTLETGHPADPHVWLSPALAQREVRNIQQAFIQADPEHKEAYDKNADAYVAQLAQLDEQYKSTLAGVKSRDFVTSHAAFAYLAQEYGLHQVPIAGLSPDQEPSPKQLAHVITFTREHRVKTHLF